MKSVAEKVMRAVQGTSVSGRSVVPADERVRSTVPALAALRGMASLLRSAHPRRRVKEPRSAQVHSPFRGRGMEYAESRPYSAGDDARHVDWRVSARTGQLHSKLYHAERERVTAILCDAGPWMAFGSRGCFKSVQAARIAALFIWDALSRGDRVAAASNHASQSLLAPAGGERGALRVLAQLCRWQPAPREVGPGLIPMASALAKLERVIRPGSRLLIIADAHAVDAATLKRLEHLRLHHDVLVALMVDPLELRAPPNGGYPVSDGVRTVWLDASNAKARQQWGRTLGGVWRAQSEELRRIGIGVRVVSTDESPLEALRGLMHGTSSEPAA
jgi:uncharacterized protein (DUF58 family)